MGMTIDEAKEWLKLAVPIKALTQEEFETFIQAVNLAVDTMCKYQKIEDIYYHQSGFALEDSLREVIENDRYSNSDS